MRRERSSSTWRTGAGATRCSTRSTFRTTWLPRVYESTENAGAGDQAAGALGVGIDVPGPLSIVLGTSGVVFGVLPAYGADDQARLHTFCHAVPGTWHAMGVMLSAAGSLRWLRDVVGGDYPQLLADAERWPAGSEGLLFQPYLTGERTPHPDPDARAAFVGLTVRHDRGALVRAVLEGVAYGLRDSLELLRELGFEPEVGRISGGGARSELWCRIVASVLGLPLERTAVDEGAAFGAALLGGVRAGVYADAHEAVASAVRVTARVEPEASWLRRHMRTATRTTARSTPPSGRFRTYDRRVPLALAAAEALLDEIGELLAIMLRISRRIENADEPMTATQRLALMEVAIVGPMRLSNLAARMDTTPATASRAIDVLQRYELVVRRPDPDDGRATLIAATPKGKRWTDERRSLVLSILEQLDTEGVPAPSLTPGLAALNAALRGATGHDAVARGALLAP